MNSVLQVVVKHTQLAQAFVVSIITTVVTISSKGYTLHCFEFYHWICSSIADHSGSGL